MAVFMPAIAVLGRALMAVALAWSLGRLASLASLNVLLVAESEGEVRSFAHAAPRPERATGAEIRAFFAHPLVWEAVSRACSCTTSVVCSSNAQLSEYPAPTRLHFGGPHSILDQ